MPQAASREERRLDGLVILWRPRRSAASGLAVALSTTPGLSHSNTWPVRPRHTLSRHTVGLKSLRATYCVPSSVRVRAHLARAGSLNTIALLSRPKLALNFCSVPPIGNSEPVSIARREPSGMGEQHTASQARTSTPLCTQSCTWSNGGHMDVARRHLSDRFQGADEAVRQGSWAGPPPNRWRQATVLTATG
jgi:hypothetical protein